MEEIALTPREQDILKLLCEGFSDRAIAEQLVLSVGTVKWYNKQIFAKLSVNNRVQATLAANKLGLLAVTSDYSPPQHLPLPLTSFIGRTENIKAVCDLVKDNRLVTIVGSGGIRKTRLAIEVAQRSGQHDCSVVGNLSRQPFPNPQQSQSYGDVPRLLRHFCFFILVWQHPTNPS
jgi:DNA-binding CsgD family transcriptional regulator